MKLASKQKETPDENCRVLIKKGPVSVETSLKELEENYASKLEWKVIEDGGVLRQHPCGGAQDGESSSPLVGNCSRGWILGSRR